MTRIDLTDLPADQRDQIEREVRTAKTLAELTRQAHERREQEERERQEKVKADAESRRQNLAAKAETEVKARYMQTGATEADWERERGRLLALYREDVALGRRQSADDAARDASMRRTLNSF